MSDGIDIVDCHVHVFPHEIVGNRATYLARDGWFSTLYENPRASLIACEALIEAMDAAGVRRAVLCGFPWADPGLCRDHNDYLHAVAAQYPDRLCWLGIVVPCESGVVAETRRCFELGAVGIGELNADAQGFDWRDGDCLASFVDVCLAFQKPLLLHASEAVGHRYPGKGTATPDKLLEFVRAFPTLSIIAAHWGGGLPFHELMPEIAMATRNVVYDCSASTYLYRPQVFRSVLDIVGPDRVLFGSDYPVLRMDRFVRRVLALAWRDDEERARVMGGNTRRMFGLPAYEGERP
jgi:predicted TIM-barrel fold metal-dependent hydrolase